MLKMKIFSNEWLHALNYVENEMKIPIKEELHKVIAKNIAI